MLLEVKKYDIICFQLRNSLYNQLQNPLKKELHQLSTAIKRIIGNGEKIDILSTEMLSAIFNLRIKALKWLSADDNFDYSEMMKESFLQIEKLKLNKKFEVLIDNILFALRCNIRVIDAIISSNEHKTAASLSFDTIQEITYYQFITSLAIVNFDDDTTQKIVDFTNASLNIEFVIVACDIIFNEKLKITDKVINDLAFLIADAAQDYIALATEFGILKSRAKAQSQSFSTINFDNNFIKEQKEFSDLGLNEYALNILNS